MSDTKQPLSQEELLRIILDAIPLSIFWKDLELKYLGGNRQLLDNIGIERVEDLVGICDYDIFKHPEEAEIYRKDDKYVLDTGKPLLHIEEPLPIEGKPLKWLLTNKVPLRSKDGKIIGLIGTFEDITDRVNYRRMVEHQALIDPLTGLGNRRKLQQDIGANDQGLGGLLFIDLDHFKQVNDTLGHSVGDAILIEVAKRLSALAVVSESSIYRLGGDEFSLYNRVNIDDDIPQVLAHIAQRALRELTKPFTINHHVINIGASIGITILNDSPTNQVDGFTEADMAMYHAKREGRNTYRFFDQEMRDANRKLHTLHNALHHALQRNEFSLAFQAQINQGKKLVGAEALLRWDSAELGTVSPADFIPIAEQTGLIHTLGKWVITEAIRTLCAWKSKFSLSPEFTLAINVSAVQFKDPNFPDFVQGVLHSLGNQLSAQIVGHLEFEITEGWLLEERALAISAMQRLQKIGVSFAIDDFGTGYSSLDYLSSLPINRLKIDKSFVRNLSSNRTNTKIIETIIILAKSLEIEIIAEGVERQEQLAILNQLGCHDYQGFFFGQPLAVKDFEYSYF